MSIGERITELRKSASLSQGDLAKQMGVSRQAVSKWENDLASPDTLKLIQLADVLNTEVEYLATGRKPVYESTPIIVNPVRTEEKIVEVKQIVEKPVIKKVYRTKYLRNPVEMIGIGAISFFVGLIIGLIL